ncbi:MAG TPA: radical SAM protein [Candidatus Angelobacter sp.]|jgi:radical SAM superfamily enzyme YgiQ (UPF0313 family)|nr:radical SAM protein [Candidatus Angelobacter sp.]
MHVCLISAPTATPSEDRWKLDCDEIYNISPNIPLGVITLAGQLDAIGIKVDVVDLDLWAFDFVRSGELDRGTPFSTFIAEQLDGMHVDLFGFSSICSGYPTTIRAAQHLKKLRKDAIVVLGGPQASAVDRETLRSFPFIDYVFRGEADHSLPEFVRRFQSGADIEGIPGLTYRRGAEVCRAPDPPVIADLDTMPSPAYHLHPNIHQLKSLPIEIGRGCPFSCSFCSTNDFFRRKFRLKSPSAVIRMMDDLAHRYSPDFFDLVHDMFTVDRRRVVSFCEAILASGRQYRWGCSARTDCIDQELIELMARAGCVSIFFGIESGSPRIQNVIDKHLDLDQAECHITATARCKMTTTVSCITGFAEEERSDVCATLNFIARSMRSPQVEPHLHILSPLAGTPVHSRYRDKLILEDLFNAVSHPGWSQDVCDTHLIADFPDIFPNFYAVPTPALERRYILELREFFLRTINRFRWLLVAWFDRCGDLLSLYDDWHTWSRRLLSNTSGLEMRHYYTTWQFDRHFVEFLKQRPQNSRGIFETILLEFEKALIDIILDRSEQKSLTKRPVILNGDMHIELDRFVHVLHLDSDVNQAIKFLQMGSPPNDTLWRPISVATRLVSEERIEVLEISSLVAEFLRLCREPITIGDILGKFAKYCPISGKLKKLDLAQLTLRTLYNQRLLRIVSQPI